MPGVPVDDTALLVVVAAAGGVWGILALTVALDGLAAAQRVGDGTGLLLVDLDDFKDGNTLFGYTGGDRVLCAAILAHGVTESGMRRLADRLFEFVRLADGALALDGFELSASAGWAVYPSQAENSTELFERADHALAEAKIGGKGTWKASASADPLPPFS